MSDEEEVDEPVSNNGILVFIVYYFVKAYDKGFIKHQIDWLVSSS